jgi:plasmid stability protein
MFARLARRVHLRWLQLDLPKVSFQRLGSAFSLPPSAFIIDSIASNDDILAMSTTLTIRNLAAPVKHRLRVWAASHGRSMEAEAREILTLALEGAQVAPPELVSEMRKRLAAIRGTWKTHSGGKSSGEIMRELRSDG